MKPLKVVEKLWGIETWLRNDRICAKVLTLRPNWSSSFHFHRKKDEIFYIVQGGCWFQLGSKKHWLTEGDWVRIKPNVRHRFWLDTDVSGNCVILEASTHHYESDVVRIKPSYRLKSVSHLTQLEKVV